ncbi:hypothetical protein, partial [Actinomadura sp. RB99]|uniref:hypothetical protein n=1 Tax=Actinomadura sp. RB99 TaxID=2691577 RepID=UPI0016862882
MPIFTRGINIARALLPRLTPLVKTAAGSVGDFTKQIEKDVKGPGVTKFIGRLNDAAKKTLPPLLRSARNVGIGIAGIVDAFLPHAGAMASGVEGLTKKFAEWGKGLKSSEGFGKFIAYIRANLPQLQTTFGNLVQIVINLATAFEPMSGISLQLVKSLTGILAALPPPVVTTLATAIVAVTTAMRIWIPIQTTLNFLLSANPIGIVVLAIAALAVGLVVAYKKSATFRAVVQGAWKGIQSAARTAWKGYIQPALTGLERGIKSVSQTWG